MAEFREEEKHSLDEVFIMLNLHDPLRFNLWTTIKALDSRRVSCYINKKLAQKLIISSELS